MRSLFHKPRVAGAAALLLALMPALAAAQSPPSPAPADPVQREMQAASELLAQAVAEFEGAQQSRSIRMFEEVISRLEGLRRAKTLPPRGRDLLAQAYELNGRAYYNIGLQEKCADSFRSLVQVQPQYTLTKEKVSPKIVDYFNSVKKALVGYLAVSSTPSGAKVSLNGEPLGLTNFFPMEVLAGEYSVEIVKEGYRSEGRQVSIAPRATEVLDVPLTRVTASYFFVTEPTDVEIWLDGEQRATATGTLAPDLVEMARSRGIDPARASSRTEVANIGIGTHTVEFRKKCFDPVKFSLEVTEATDYEGAPVRLEESVGSLSLRSDPPGGKIYLDAEYKGVTPMDIEGVCAGRHRLEVKHAAGKFIQEITVPKNEGIRWDCPIRPSLAFLGVVAESAAGERLILEVEERIVQNLSKINSLNFVLAPREQVERILGDLKLNRRTLVQKADRDALRAASEALSRQLEVQGLLVAVLPEERLQRTAVLHLLAGGSIEADRWDVAFSETASYRRFIDAVDQPVELYRPWTGLITVDTRIHEDGVPVLRVVPGSPAEQAGVQPGEILYSADGKPVRRTADLLAAVEGKKEKDPLPLLLKGASGSHSADLALARTPQEIPLNKPTLLYNKVMMDLRQQVEGYPGTPDAAFARLNLAICAMHFSDFAGAHEHLLKAKDELPNRPGISQGTAFYYLGVALDRLGDYKKEAAEAYRKAATFQDATLFNNDGPAVAPLAARRAGGS